MKNGSKRPLIRYQASRIYSIFYSCDKHAKKNIVVDVMYTIILVVSKIVLKNWSSVLFAVICIINLQNS